MGAKRKILDKRILDIGIFHRPIDTPRGKAGWCVEGFIFCRGDRSTLYFGPYLTEYDAKEKEAELFAKYSKYIPKPVFKEDIQMRANILKIKYNRINIQEFKTDAEIAELNQLEQSIETISKLICEDSDD